MFKRDHRPDAEVSIDPFGNFKSIIQQRLTDFVKNKVPPSFWIDAIQLHFLTSENSKLHDKIPNNLSLNRLALFFVVRPKGMQQTLIRVAYLLLGFRNNAGVVLTNFYFNRMEINADALLRFLKTDQEQIVASRPLFKG